MRFRLRPQDTEFSIDCDCDAIRDAIANRFRHLMDFSSSAPAGFPIDIRVARDAEGRRRVAFMASFDDPHCEAYAAFTGDVGALAEDVDLYLAGENFLLYRPHDLALLYRQDSASILVGENRYRESRSRPRLQKKIASRDGDGPPAMVGRPAQYPIDDISELLRFVYAYHHSLISLHGAVLEWDHKGIVIFAPSGGGKSTTALALASQGAQLCSDENLFIEAAGDGLAVWGLMLPIRVALDEALARTMRDTGSEPGFHSQTKQEVPLDTWGIHIAVGNAVVPHLLLFLGDRSGDEQSRIRRLSESEAMGRMMSQVLEPAVSLRKGVIGLRIIELAAAVPAWEVNAGSDLQQLAAMILNYVETQ